MSVIHRKQLKMKQHKGGMISMRMNPIEFKVHLDKRYKPREILNFLIDEGFEGRFVPLFNGKTDSFAPFESTDDLLKAAVIKDLSALPQIVFDNTVYGAFLIEIDSRRTALSRFNRPRINKNSTGKLNLDWSEIQPAIVIDIHTHSFPGEYIYYVDVTVSHGLWGTRNRWLKAFLKVLEKQTSAEWVKSLWKDDESLFKQLKSDYEILKKLEIETEIIDFEKIRDTIWNTMSSICSKFSTEGQTVFISPDYRKKSTTVPVNITTCCNDRPTFNPLKIPDEAWRTSILLDCLSVNSPDTLRDRTVRYWTSCEDEKAFLQLVEESEKGNKDTWDSIVEIMTKRPESEAILNKLISLQADPNWPGSVAARSHLLNNVGVRAVSTIEKSINLAREIGDDWWAENLGDLLEEIDKKRKTK